MEKPKKNLKVLFKNSIVFKSEFYVKLSLIILVASVFIVIFITQNGRMFFEYYAYAEKFRNNDFQIHVIDVGNGDALLIKFPNNETMMIDTGSNHYEKKVTSYIQQYLWSEDLNKIDYLVLTHPDSDHVGGASEILDRFKVLTLYRPKIYSKLEYEMIEEKNDYNISSTVAYDEVIMKAYSKKCNMAFNEGGISFQKGGVLVEFLAPLYTSYSQTNNYSAVIKITYQSKSFLFMGDADKSVEEDLIEEYGDNLDIDVLKVGHHGSYTSSSEKFLEIVSPEYSILSCKETEYFPHKNVVANLNAVNSKILSTGVRGSFAMSIDNGELVYANAEKPSNHFALVLTIFLLIIFIIWENPFKKIKPLINKINND